MTTTHPTILALDPGTRFLGAAVLRGKELLAYGVHELKNGERPYDVIGQARRVVFGYIAQHAHTAKLLTMKNETELARAAPATRSHPEFSRRLVPSHKIAAYHAYVTKWSQEN